MKSVLLFFCLVTLCAFSSQASYKLGGGLDFKDDATSVAVRLDVVPSGQQLEFGEVDCLEYGKIITRISRMGQLKELNIVFLGTPGNEFVFPAEALGGLTNLVSLAISNFGTNSVRVTSISTCRQSPLEDLTLNNILMDDVAFIHELKKLESLSCTSEEVLRSAPDCLQVLHVADASISGCLDLKRFFRLKSLHLCRIGCSSIRGFDSLPQLESLSLHGVPINDLYMVGTCTNLNHLEVVDCKWDNANFSFSNFKSIPLKELELENVPIIEVRGLEACPLTDLRINGSEIQSLNDICRLPMLERLDVIDTKINIVDKNSAKRKFPKLVSLWYIDSANDGLTCYEW